MQMAFPRLTVPQDREHTIVTHSWKGVYVCGGTCRYGKTERVIVPRGNIVRRVATKFTVHGLDSLTPSDNLTV